VTLIWLGIRLLILPFLVAWICFLHFIMFKRESRDTVIFFLVPFLLWHCSMLVPVLNLLVVLWRDLVLGISWELGSAPLLLCRVG